MSALFRFNPKLCPQITKPVPGDSVVIALALKHQPEHEALASEAFLVQALLLMGKSTPRLYLYQQGVYDVLDVRCV